MPREVHFYLLEDYFHLDEIFCLELRLCRTLHWKIYPYHQVLRSRTIDNEALHISVQLQHRSLLKSHQIIVQYNLCKMATLKKIKNGFQDGLYKLNAAKGTFCNTFDLH